jgi:AcrR family transcriptional regulator
MNESNNTEQDILVAAEKLFLLKGFALTSTTEIAREAGCNQALVHYYYRTKEKLFTRIFQQKVYLFLANFTDGGRGNVSFEEKIRKMAEAHFDMLIKNQQLPFFIFTELILNEGRLNILMDSLDENYVRVYNILNDELREEIRKGHVREMTFLDIILAIVSLNGMLFLLNPILRKGFSGTGNDFREFVNHRREENLRIILQSLKP